MTLRSLTWFTLRDIVPKTGTGTFLITTDNFGNSPTLTDVSVVFQNTDETLFEMMTASITGDEITISQRGLDASDTKTTDTSLQREWRPGTIIYITAFASDLGDLQGNNTWSGNNTFSGANTFSNTTTFTAPVIVSGTTSYIRFPQLTTTQRNALTPVNGMVVYDSTEGQNYQYIAGNWSAFSAGSTQPNASPTVAGKVEAPTSLEYLAGTDIGGTGALMFALPSQVKSSFDNLIHGATEKTTPVDADEFGISDSAATWANKKVTYTNLQEALNTNVRTHTAGESISAGDALSLSTSDGKVYKADANDGTRLNFIGFAMASASTDALVKVQVSGNYTTSGLTAGSVYYLSDTAGTISTTSGQNQTIVGYAISTTKLKIHYMDFLVRPIAGTTYTYGQSNTEATTTNTTMTKVKEIQVLKSGTYTVYFELSSKSSGNNAEGQIYKNGVAVGTLRTRFGSYLGYSENLTFDTGDLVQIYIRQSSASANAIGAQNYSLKYSRVIDTAYAGVVNL